MIKIWGRVLQRGMSIFEHIHFFDSMYFPVILTQRISNFSATIVGYTGLRKKFKQYSGEISPLEVHKK